NQAVMQPSARVPARPTGQGVPPSGPPGTRPPGAPAPGARVAVAPPLPMRAAGLQLLGRYEGSGFRDEHFLASRSDGQVVHLSALLYYVLSELAPGRSADDVARAVSAQIGKVLP